MRKIVLTKIVVIMASLVMLTSYATEPAPASTPISPSNSYNTALWQGNPSEIWEKLQPLSTTTLAALQNKTSNSDQRAWFELALISKHKHAETPQLAQALADWRAKHAAHPANALLPSDDILERLQISAPPEQIALLLPDSGAYAKAGQLVRAGFLNAYYAGASGAPRANIKLYDSTQAPTMAALYQKAVAEGAQVVIGPLTKNQVQQLSKNGSFDSPTLALNYTDGKPNKLPTNFYEFGLLPEDETTQLADRAIHAGYSRALIIAPQTSWGDRLVAAFSTRWKTLGGKTQATWRYKAHADFTQGVARLLKIDPEMDASLMKLGSDKTTLQEQRRHDFDVIFLFAQPQEAHTIVPLLRYYYVNNDVAIYATPSVYSGRPDPLKDTDLNGITICDIPWKKETHGDQNRLYAVGQDAYLLSQALGRLTDLPNFPIYGTTGALTLTGNHQIHRHLPCKTVKNGLV